MSRIFSARRARVLVWMSLPVLSISAACSSSDSKPNTASQTQASAPATASSSSGGTATTPSAPASDAVEINVTGGQVAGGAKDIDVALGDTVTLRVTADVAEELHVHGYDIKRDLTPGAAVEVSFTADIPGVFEIELEKSGLQIASLTVS